MTKQSLLDINQLNISFWTEQDYLHALDDVSFSIEKGEILGVVGESGCGKSVTADAILRLHDEQLTDYSGEIRFQQTNLLTLSEKQMRKVRGNQISMIFQDPMSSLNPVFTVGEQIVESLKLHKKMSKKEAKAKAIELLDIVGIPSPELRYFDYPHQLSGGMRQRVMIAIAISCEPQLLIADEPTTALDVTIQAQILNRLKWLKEKNGMSVLLITHDLGVVAQTCDRVVVMYLGQVIEIASVQELFAAPKHPYTKGLMQAMPQPTSNREERLFEIEGTVPSLANIPSGCRFANRCVHATTRCTEEAPKLLEDASGRPVRCHYTSQLNEEGSNDKQLAFT